MKKILGVVSLLVLSMTSCFSIGAEDVTVYMSMKNDRGEKLSQMILKFGEYDLRGEKKEGGVRVVVTGCMRCPGVYLIPKTMTFGDLLRRIHIISVKEHPAHTYLSRVKRFRKGEEMTMVNANHADIKKEKLKNGDVINFLAVVL